jgi:hypothetical protein
MSKYGVETPHIPCQKESNLTQEHEKLLPHYSWIKRDYSLSITKKEDSAH